jgi:hypothetical protein
MGINPHSGQSKVRLFSLSILTNTIVNSGGSELLDPFSPISWDDYPRLPNHHWWVRALNPNCLFVKCVDPKWLAPLKTLSQQNNNNSIK